MNSAITPDRQQLKTLLTIDDWGQMAIKNSVSNDFLSTSLDSINVLDCRLSGGNRGTQRLDSIYHTTLKLF